MNSSLTARVRPPAARALMEVIAATRNDEGVCRPRHARATQRKGIGSCSYLNPLRLRCLLIGLIIESLYAAETGPMPGLRCGRAQGRR